MPTFFFYNNRSSYWANTLCFLSVRFDIFSSPYLISTNLIGFSVTIKQHNKIISLQSTSAVVFWFSKNVNLMNWGGSQKPRCHNSQRIDLCITSILRNTIKMFDQIVTCNSCAFLDIVERILKNTLNKHLSLFRKGLCKGLCKEEDRMYAYCYKNNSITFFFPESDQFF